MKSPEILLIIGGLIIKERIGQDQWIVIVIFYANGFADYPERNIKKSVVRGFAFKILQ